MLSFCCITKWISYVYIYPPIPSLLRLPLTLPPYPTPLGGHKAPSWSPCDLPVLCGCFPLAIYFTFGSVYMSMPLSHFVPASPSPSPCPQAHSPHLRLYSCPAPRFWSKWFLNLDMDVPLFLPGYSYEGASLVSSWARWAGKWGIGFCAAAITLSTA